MTEVYYRYDEVAWSAGADEYGDPISRRPGSGITVECYEYEVISRTPKGVWISVYGDKRFVNNDWAKRYALPTKEEALKSFIARKTRQIKIYEAKHADAKAALLIAQRMENTNDNTTTHHSP